MEEQNKKNKTALIVIIIVLLLLLLLGVYFLFLRKSPNGEPAIKLVSTNPVTKGGIYEDEVIKMQVLPEWGKRVLKAPQQGVELLKDKYVITVVTNFVSAGGVEGGRFSEVALLTTPWLTPQTASDCEGAISKEESSVTDSIMVHNMYFYASGADFNTKQKCGNPRVGGELWYGTYFGTGNYFSISAPLSKQVYIGIKYDTDSLDNAPWKGDASLQKVISDASEMVKMMEFKTPPTVDVNASTTIVE